MDKLRLMFEKTGRAVYISHLDLMRTMMRGFQRAGLRLRCSEGFNPHAKISIALPLSVGAESVCELLDFELEEDADLTALPDRLTAVLPEGVRVTAVWRPLRKCAGIKWLALEGRFEYDSADTGLMARSLMALFSSPELIITRRTKRGEGEVDIIPSIRRVSFRPVEKAVEVEAVVSAQEPTFNPELFVSCTRQLEPELAPDFAVFRRLEIYDENMEIFR